LAEQTKTCLTPQYHIQNPITVAIGAAQLAVRGDDMSQMVSALMATVERLSGDIKTLKSRHEDFAFQALMHRNALDHQNSLANLYNPQFYNSNSYNPDLNNLDIYAINTMSGIRSEPSKKK
jgi:hypothetical protein